MSPAGLLHGLLTAMLAVLLSMGTVHASDAVPELNLYIWDDYLDPAVVERFEKQFHARINIVTFDDDDQREERLLATQGRGMDIICINDVYMYAPATLSWIAPLDLQRLPNLKHVEYPFDDQVPQARRYAVPYFWGTHGIAYRDDLLVTPPASWLDLFSLAPKYDGKIIQPSTLRLLIGIALLAAGKDFNSENSQDLQEASQLLLAQAPYLLGYQTAEVSEENQLVTGNAVMAPMFNGDVLSIQEHNPHIQFVHPREGVHVWVDYLVVSKDSPNLTLAFQFLNFLNEPEIALKNARYLNYATPNLAAKAMADDNYRNNPIIFPTEAILAKAHLMRPLSLSTQHLQTAIYVRTLILFESLLKEP